jgi:hypothetical protein
MGGKIRSWRWRRRVPPTHWSQSIIFHGLVTQMNTMSTPKPRKPGSLYSVWLFCKDFTIFIYVRICQCLRLCCYPYRGVSGLVLRLVRVRSTVDKIVLDVVLFWSLSIYPTVLIPQCSIGITSRACSKHHYERNAFEDPPNRNKINTIVYAVSATSLNDTHDCYQKIAPSRRNVGPIGLLPAPHANINCVSFTKWCWSLSLEHSLSVIERVTSNLQPFLYTLCPLQLWLRAVCFVELFKDSFSMETT